MTLSNVETLTQINLDEQLAGRVGSQPAIHARCIRSFGRAGNQRGTFNSGARLVDRELGFAHHKPRPGEVKMKSTVSSKAQTSRKESNMRLTGKHYGIIIATLATALLHLSLLPQFGPNPIALNGLVYLILLGAYFLPIPFLQQRHQLVWWALLGYTVLTFILWIILGDKHFVFGTSSAIGYYAKVAELFLMGFLLADRPRS